MKKETQIRWKKELRSKQRIQNHKDPTFLKLE